MPNNFSLIRLCAAMLVIFSHAFGFSGLSDPFMIYLGAGGGIIAVYVFFSISGYLISESWFRDPRLFSFFSKRILRIYPALILVITLSVFVFGPILTRLSMRDYFANPETYTYFMNLTLWKLKYRLPEIFVDGYDFVLNAPLWTLFFEFAMYLTLPLFALMGLNKKENLPTIWFVFFLFLGIDFYGVPKDLFLIKINAHYFIKFFLYFYSGVLFRHYFDKIHFNGWVAIIFFMVTIMSKGTIFSGLSLWLLIVTFVFWFAFIEWKPLKFLVDKKDYSYGIYLYGYIIQIFIQQYLDDNLRLIYKIPISIAGAFIFAYISWHPPNPGRCD